MLGLEYESKRGYISIDYYGRTVGIKIMPVGIHMGQLEDGLKLPDTVERIKELKAEFEGKVVLLGVDDMDIFKGISLKFLAMEELLRQNPKWVGKVVLVQIANPARGRGKDVEELQLEAESAALRINKTYGFEGYSPVILIEERTIPLYERIAYYHIAECCIVTAVRDGMNLIPYEYIVCRQSTPELDHMQGLSNDAKCPKRSMLIVSEFIGCSPSLSGAVRVNPWNIEAVAEAMNSAIIMPEAEKQMRHEKHYKYISTHDVAYWAQSCVGDLERACKDHPRWLCYGLGFGLKFRVVALEPHFQKLLLDEHIASSYKKAKSRAIFLDYDGTMVPQGSINKAPSENVLAVLDELCRDPCNMVFLVSGRGCHPLSEWFSSCENLGIAAEHGFFYR
jgi:trehalose 6-phosphate synthase/phosphatase